MTGLRVLLPGLLACASAACSGQIEPLPTTTAPFADVPAADPHAPAPTDGKPVALRMTKLFYGDTDWNGQESPTAWKSFGHDIDGTTSLDGQGPCRLAAGAPRSTSHDSIANRFVSWPA